MNSDMKTLEENFSKLDEPLQEELFSYYRQSTAFFSFFEDTVRKLRYFLKPIDVIVQFSHDCCPNNKRLSKRIINEKNKHKSPEQNENFCYYAKLTPKNIVSLLKCQEVKSIQIGYDNQPNN